MLLISKFTVSAVPASTIQLYFMAIITINKTEKEEKRYLETIKTRLLKAINDADAAVGAQSKEIQESKDYLWENRSGMDHVEKVAVRQSITQIALTGENAAERKKRLAKLLANPYFGRIDFAEEGNDKPEPLYIGTFSFYDQREKENLVYDWRAPVASMYYDFELGKAYFESPKGKVEGEISLKRQYRIRSGTMEFMLESSLNIHDDILQKELSQTSSDKMKNIVATIQRDQNAIIRNEESRVLIIQGVAGSGKTSIALHRIAFLLYRFKETIRSEDILIISPNKVFADYISNVLPELGEEKIRETSMEELADELLGGKIRFQTFFEQVSHLLERSDENFRGRIRFKSGFEFISKLNEFLVHIENELFKPELLMVKRYPVPADYLGEKYKTYHRLPLFKRIDSMVTDIVNDLNFYNRYVVTTAERNQVRKDLVKMFKTLNLRTLYKEFYTWLGRPELLKMQKGSKYEYADVFPLVYLKISLEGVQGYHEVKHLVVDEMQDYTPLQYSILAKLFPANKTILGDVNQSVNPYGFSDTGAIGRVFPNAETVKMVKSYRSTFEIVELAQKIRVNEDMEVVDRHGQPPAIIQCRSDEDELKEIGNLISQFVQSSYNSLGIICKTQDQAEKLYEAIRDQHRQMYVLNSQSASYVNGIIISTAHMAKGLEFDQVIVPSVNSRNYRSETDRQMLYVACTRAMHRLDLTYAGKRTALLKE